MRVSAKKFAPLESSSRKTGHNSTAFFMKPTAFYDMRRFLRDRSFMCSLTHSRKRIHVNMRPGDRLPRHI